MTSIMGPRCERWLLDVKIFHPCSFREISADATQGVLSEWERTTSDDFSKQEKRTSSALITFHKFMFDSRAGYNILVVGAIQDDSRCRDIMPTDSDIICRFLQTEYENPD